MGQETASVPSVFAGVFLKAHIAGQLGGDFIIFPSSIHETILAKAEGFSDWEAVEAIVREINRKEVELEDILSDTVYSRNRYANPVIRFTALRAFYRNLLRKFR